MRMRLGLALMSLVLVVGSLSALDLGLDLSVAASADSGSPSGSLVEHFQAGNALSKPVYAKLEVAHSTGFWSSTSLNFLPLRSEALATIEYIADLGMAGLTVGVRGIAARTVFELGAFASGSLPLVGDLAALDGELRVATDLSGLFGTLKALPTLYLPLDRPVMVDLGITVGAALGRYQGQAFDGPAFVEFRPEVLVSLDPSVSLSLAGGYAIDLAGGRYLAQPSGVFASVKLGLSLEGPGD
ncbi:MAG: hypothetical protein WCL50_10650 [Spirochaetota bacterium]